ncbi:MAG: hypothetical protein GX121_07355 [Ignavibacteria bacterium]|jgi:hypothetical protein|nr:hypothetical protein [Ignavibacteria bacterium]
MKEHYDFSEGEKGKFFVPEEKIELPIYLNDNNRNYYLELARSKNIPVSKLINNILAKERDMLNLVLSE